MSVKPPRITWEVPPALVIEKQIFGEIDEQINAVIQALYSERYHFKKKYFNSWHTSATMVLLSSVKPIIEGEIQKQTGQPVKVLFPDGNATIFIQVNGKDYLPDALNAVNPFPAGMVERVIASIKQNATAATNQALNEILNSPEYLNDANIIQWKKIEELNDTFEKNQKKEKEREEKEKVSREEGEKRCTILGGLSKIMVNGIEKTQRTRLRNSLMKFIPWRSDKAPSEQAEIREYHSEVSIGCFHASYYKDTRYTGNIFEPFANMPCFIPLKCRSTK